MFWQNILKIVNCSIIISQCISSYRSGLDTAKIGITVRVPLDEEAGTKTADLVVYAEAD